MEQRLSVITLAAADLAASRRFYEALGWRQAERSKPELVLFQLGQLLLALYPWDALAEDCGLGGTVASGGGERPPHAGFRGVALAHNVRHREDVDQLLTRAVDAGATLLQPAAEVAWGGYRGYFGDPDGHPWEVVWNPHWSMGPRGDLRL